MVVNLGVICRRNDPTGVISDLELNAGRMKRGENGEEDDKFSECSTSKMIIWGHNSDCLGDVINKSKRSDYKDKSVGLKKLSPGKRLWDGY